MKHVTMTLTAAALFATLSGCSSNNPGLNGSYNLNAIKSGIAVGEFKNDQGQPITPKQEAEQLALAAEQLAQSSNFIYASQLTNAALAVDPTNVRAKFWKAMVAPVMQLKGFMTRIEPLAQKTPGRYQEYLRTKEEFQSSAMTKAVSDFVFDGPKDIQSEDEIQDTIARIVLKMDEARKIMKNLKSEELVIYRTTDSVSKQELERQQLACSATQTNGVITVKGCDLSQAYRVKLSDADFEVLQQAIAGYEVYIGLMNTYSAHGAVAVAQKHLPKDQMIGELLQDPQFGKLRDGRTIALIPELAIDAVQATRTAIKMEKDLCASSKTSTWTRPGYALSEGSCALPDDSFNAALKTVVLAAKGPATFTATVNNQPREVTIDVPTFVQHPITDLRAIKPAGTDHCGGPTGFADPTFSGLFPKGDVLTATSSQACQ